jgi:hypothetical protein
MFKSVLKSIAQEQVRLGRSVGVAAFNTKWLSCSGSMAMSWMWGQRRHGAIHAPRGTVKWKIGSCGEQRLVERRPGTPGHRVRA